jgi:hypothetical protein
LFDGGQFEAVPGRKFETVPADGKEGLPEVVVRQDLSEQFFDVSLGHFGFSEGLSLQEPCRDGGCAVEAGTG